MKTNKIFSYLTVSFLCFLLTGGTLVYAASPAKQLAKGISLYEKNKDSEAMDYFIDVMVHGDKDQVAEANKYVELIHNRIGGIQTPVEVDVNFKEGEVKTLDDVATDAVAEAQQQAQAAAAEAQAKAQEAQEQAAAAKEGLVNDVNAQQQALTDRIEAQRLAAQEAADTARQNALQAATDVNEAAVEASTVAGVATVAGTAVQNADEQAVANQTQAVTDAARQEGTLTSSADSTFTDLTSPEAVEARDLYTNQKLDSMTAAAIEKINAAKGVHLYFRDNMPDALDIDADVLFDGNKFRPEALPLLNSIYEMLALVQGAGYVILPPGSYTDDVTLSGIRQAMALNSYFVNRGISQGKLHYNLGLADQEPPARFANLNGLAIVFDYTAKLPTRMEKNEGNEKAPLLSMAIVPQCHAIDRALGEAYAVDFSVLETVNPIDNWLLQVVQHGRDGNYYVVRQLEGFTPVYHQILWNGRKGIIGPELPCGKYTLVLTATDLKGQKQTLRRRVIVKCSAQKKTASASCGTSACQTAVTGDELCPSCNYKTERLWTKPTRTMTASHAPAEQPVETQAQTETAAPAADVTTTVPVDTPDTLGSAAYPSTQQPYSPYDTPTNAQAYTTQPSTAPVNNPYDMPYEDYGTGSAN
ncbi:hypothetical protein [Candidatus Avelusimicrobium stercoris]|uniref:hypothetical protein n=1 Tax=Candidatus Avelusimicrobium stercoris TaxID=1947924 RepID=UPI003D129F26